MPPGEARETAWPRAAGVEIRVNLLRAAKGWSLADTALGRLQAKGPMRLRETDSSVFVRRLSPAMFGRHKYSLSQGYGLP